MTTKTPYKGLGADSEEKHEPASDIDTMVDSLKVLDPKRPIREADKFGAGQHFAFVPGAEVNRIDILNVGGGGFHL